MNEIKSVFNYSARTAYIKFHNTEIAKRAKPGNFLILRFEEDGPRLPFSIIETEPESGMVEIIIHKAEGLDDFKPLLKEGLSLPDVLGPLGKAPEIDKDKRVLCCGDGAGFIPLIPIIRELHKRGCNVWAVMTERTERISCISDEVESYCDRVILAPDSGLYEILKKEIESNGVEKIWMSGPSELLKEITKVADDLDIDADCILNMIMIDGIGLCGTCRVIVDGKRLQTCIDGPVFDARKVDFNQLLNRQRLF